MKAWAPSGSRDATAADLPRPGRGRGGYRESKRGSVSSARVLGGFKASVLQVVCAVIALGIFGLPLAYMVLQSLKTYTGFLRDPTGWPHPFTFGNYGAAWTQGNFAHEMINSLIYAVIPDVVTLVLGVFLAFPISRNYFKHSNALYAFFLFSGFLPGALIPLFAEARLLHLYNSMLGYLVIIGLGGAGFFFFVGYIKGIPKELDEAAAMDGCSYVRFIFQIVIPQMKPALATFAVFGFVSEWNSLILPLVLLPNPGLWPVTRGLYGFFGSHTQNWPLVAAATVIVAVPIVIVFAFLQRYLVEGVAGGAASGTRGVTHGTAVGAGAPGAPV